jgi:hypothetical protein
LQNYNATAAAATSYAQRAKTAAPKQQRRQNYNAAGTLARQIANAALQQQRAQNNGTF